MWDDESILRGYYEGKDWHQISCYLALQFNSFTFKLATYQYYIQSQLLCPDYDDKGKQLGIGPSEMMLLYVDRALTKRAEEMASVFTEDQMDSISLYVLLYARAGQDGCRRAYDQLWHRYCLRGEAWLDSLSQ